MTAAIKGGFAVIAVLLYLLAAVSVLLEAHGTPGFIPNSGQEFLLDAAGGALVAFIVAQLGLAIAANRKGVGDRLNGTMGFKWGNALLIFDAVIFVVIGLWFVLLWVQPDLIAVPESSDPLTDAPAYIESQGQLFVGLALASLAGLAPAAA